MKKISKVKANNKDGDSMEINLGFESSYFTIEELGDIIEGSFDGILVTDGEGKVLLINESYERITGITKDEILGKNMKELINPIWMKNSVVFLVIEKRKPVSLRHTTRTGKNIIVTGTPTFDEDKSISKIVVNARDITEIYELREELVKSKKMELLYIENALDKDSHIESSNGIVAVSDSMKRLLNTALKVSAFDTTVLILGESGVGKDVLARYIHQNSIRRKKPFITINCGAIPKQLLESELFGYESGAFTGASTEGKRGLFEAAEGGILFLDEIGDMPKNLQVKILNVLESREITRVGSTDTIPIDVRIIAATNKDLEGAIDSGEFREDLYYRLNVVQLNIPALRNRVQDIGPLSLYFLKMYNQKYGQNKKVTYDLIESLKEYSWPGNIRELKNTLEGMIIVSNNEYLQADDLPWDSGGNKRNKLIKNLPKNDLMSLKKVVELAEKELLIKAKENYKTTREIAQKIGVNQSTVVRKLKKYNISDNKKDT